MFGNYEESPEMHGEPHLRTAPNLKGPLTARHLAVWPLSEYDRQLAETKSEYKKKYDDWTAGINRVVRAMQTTIFGWSPHPEAHAANKDEAQLINSLELFSFKDERRLCGPSAADEKPPSCAYLTGAKENLRIALSEDGVPQSAEPHFSSVTFREHSISFPIRWRGVNGFFQADRRREYVTFSFYLEIEGADSSAAAKLINAFNILTEGDKEIPKRADDLMNGVWSQFEKDLHKKMRGTELSHIAPMNASDDENQNGVGRKFNDSRVAVFVSDDGEVWLGEEARQFLTDRRESIDAALRPDGPREMIGCLALRQKALMVSNLGAGVQNVSRKIATTKPNGENYVHGPQVNTLFFFKAHQPKQQLGRLLERFFAMETSRLAALKDIKNIREASSRLRFLGMEMDKLSEKILRENTGPKGQNPKQSAPPKDDKKLTLPGLAEEIFEVGRMKRPTDTNSGEQIIGGLRYRTARAKRYEDVYKLRAKHMGFERIETWQPYEEFMERRLSVSFNYIERVGKRYKDLQRRLDIVSELQQTQKLSSLQEATKENTERTTKNTRILVRSERSSEIISYTALLFGLYHFGSDATDSIMESLSASSSGRFGNIEAGDIKFYLSLTLTALIFSMIGLVIYRLLARWAKKSKKDRSPKDD